MHKCAAVKTFVALKAGYLTINEAGVIRKEITSCVEEYSAASAGKGTLTDRKGEMQSGAKTGALTRGLQTRLTPRGRRRLKHDELFCFTLLRVISACGNCFIILVLCLTVLLVFYLRFSRFSGENSLLFCLMKTV